MDLAFLVLAKTPCPFILPTGDFPLQWVHGQRSWEIASIKNFLALGFYCRFLFDIGSPFPYIQMIKKIPFPH